MEIALVVAIIRTSALEAAEKKLYEMGVRGVTVTKAKGYGEHPVPHDFLSRDRLSLADQVKIEIYATSDQAERIAATVVDAAHTGSPGDGIVAILPVDRVFSVRTRSATIPNRARG